MRSPRRRSKLASDSSAHPTRRRPACSAPPPPALATIALLAASAGAAQAAPDDIASEPQANPAQMVASIQGQLAGRAFGWQFAIAQDGKLVQASTVGASGFALSGADAGGSPVAMAPTMLMDIARRRRRSPPSRP